MSEQAVEVINVITTSPVIKPIIITKSIKSLTEPATPANGFVLMKIIRLKNKIKHF